MEAKGKTLASMYEAQENKVTKLKEALEKTQEIQAAYGKQVLEAQANIKRCEAALSALGDETGDTSEEQAKLTKELEGYKKSYPRQRSTKRRLPGNVTPINRR